MQKACQYGKSSLGYRDDSYVDESHQEKIYTQFLNMQFNNNENR